MNPQEFRLRRQELPSTIATLLATKYFNGDCTCKKKFSFNTASEIVTDFWENEGDFSMMPYYCVRCFRWHVGHARKDRKYRCVWCGSSLKDNRIASHTRRCGRDYFQEKSPSQA